MILVDTSVWIEHLRVGDPGLTALLGHDRVLAHPWVIGELSLSRLDRRQEVLGLLGNLPSASVASDAEVLALIETRRLFGRGLGWVDVHLLAAALLSHARLWTYDRRLAAVAADQGLAALGNARS